MIENPSRGVLKFAPTSKCHGVTPLLNHPPTITGGKTVDLAEKLHPHAAGFLEGLNPTYPPVSSNIAFWKMDYL